jgi:hypothetical protein
MRSSGVILPYPLLPPVRTKTDFVRRYEALEFGNCSPTWNTWEEWCEGTIGVDPLTLYHIRNRVAGGMTWYNVPHYKMFEEYDAALTQYDPGQLYFSAMCPTPLTTIQGELMDEEGGLYLYYSDVKKPMRQSLVEGGREARRGTVNTLLRTFMNPRSYDWVQWLLAAYPGHVIEFTCLSRCWGRLPGYNTLFWEIRQY